MVHGYVTGEPLDQICDRLNTSRNTLYRRLHELEVGPREPSKKSGGYRVLVKPPEHADPLVRELFARAREQQLSLSMLAQRSGLTREAIGAWRHGRVPIVPNLQAVGNTVGLQLVWEDEEITKQEKDNE